jgi:HK97 gp10 family phage protein
MGVQIEGMQELLKRLNSIGERAEPIKEKALQEGAKVMKEAISMNAPRDTGKLAENITISDVKEGRIRIGNHPDQFYALFLEYGTTKMRPRPFMEPAFLNNKERAQQKMADVIKRELGL